MGGCEISPKKTAKFHFLVQRKLVGTSTEFRYELSLNFRKNKGRNSSSLSFLLHTTVITKTRTFHIHFYSVATQLQGFPYAWSSLAACFISSRWNGSALAIAEALNNSLSSPILSSCLKQMSSVFLSILITCYERNRAQCLLLSYGCLWQVCYFTFNMHLHCFHTEIWALLCDNPYCFPS